MKTTYFDKNSKTCNETLFKATYIVWTIVNFLIILFSVGLITYFKYYHYVIFQFLCEKYGNMILLGGSAYCLIVSVLTVIGTVNCFNYSNIENNQEKQE